MLCMYAQKSNFVLRWHNSCLRIVLLEPEYHEYEFSSTEEEAQEKINKFIDNLIFI